MKKGFTIVELIITIGLITLIGTVIVSNVSSNLLKEQERQYETFKKTLETAACVYIDRNVAKTTKAVCKTNRSCSITVNDLLINGLIEDSDLKEPLSGQNIPLSQSVLITYDTEGIKKCTYQE